MSRPYGGIKIYFPDKMVTEEYIIYLKQHSWYILLLLAVTPLYLLPLYRREHLVRNNGLMGISVKILI